MADSVAENIRDDLIEQDVRYRRVDASIRKQVDIRLAKLGRDLKGLMLEIDVAGTNRVDARRRRLRRLNVESRIMIRGAYTEVGAIVRDANKRLAKVETANTASIVRNNVP